MNLMKRTFVLLMLLVVAFFQAAQGQITSISNTPARAGLSTSGNGFSIWGMINHKCPFKRAM